MADESHGQMMLQQQPSQQSAQMQQSQQIQQSQLQQQQMQQSIQQAQIQQQQQQIQQAQIQQQQQPQMQQSQQQTVASTMPMANNTVEQSNHMNATTSLPMNVINVSQAQQMPTMQQNVNTSVGAPVQLSVSQLNTSGGTPVQMAVSQLNTSTGQPVQMTQLNTSTGQPVQMTVPQIQAQAQTVPAGTMMSQSSGPHPTMIHPTMSMAQAPLQQVQVIQQPLSASYLQHLYPQQQMLFPGNLTLQHAGMTGPTLQSIGAAQGLSLQLQAKAPLDNKSGNVQNIQPVTNKPGMAVNTGTMMTASGQVLSAAPKANFPQQMMATPGKSTIIHSQSGFAPANANQTVVIGQLGVLPNQQSIFNHKAIAESQKGKTYTFQNSPAALQPKSLYSSGMPVHSSAQVFNGGHLKQISSQPQIITTQAPGNVLNQAQLFGLQTLGASLPPGLSWATPGCLQSSALLAQNPIIIRSSQESNMFIQSQPQTAMHLPVAAATQAVPPTSFASNVSVPQKQKQVRVRPGTQTVAVATQTIVSSAATVNSNTAPIRTQIKPKAPKLLGAPGPTLLAPQMATTQTQTNQSPPQAIPQNVAQSTSPLINHQKSDASNQTPTNQVNERKPLITYSRVPVSEAKPQQIPPVLTSTVHVSTSVSTVDTVSSTMPSVSRVPPRVQGSIPEPECETTKSPSVSTEPLNNSVASQETEPMEVPVQEAEEVLKSSQQPIVQPPSEQVPSENEHLKPHQPIMKPSLGQVKEKQPQKAIVKPQVLTHVIDGFLIQEGPEPFPVRSALLDSPCRILPPEKLESNQKRKDLPAVSPEKKLKVHRGRGNVELAKCEFCGKLGPKNKFKRSKRFCSTSCAKRYNVCCSKRVGLLHPVNQANVAAGPGRRRKMLRGRKGMRKQVQVEENEDINTTAKEEVASVADDESSTFSNKTEDETTEMQTDSPDLPPVSSEKEIEMQKIESIPPSQKLPTKWSVQDVYEFIRDTPGCSEYAETFRSQEIDGQALLLLKDHHLMTSMCMKLGPALKLIEQINKLTDEFGHP